MKKIVFIFLLTLSLIACSENEVDSIKADAAKINADNVDSIKETKQVILKINDKDLKLNDKELVVFVELIDSFSINTKNQVMGLEASNKTKESVKVISDVIYSDNQIKDYKLATNTNDKEKYSYSEYTISKSNNNVDISDSFSTKTVIVFFSAIPAEICQPFLKKLLIIPTINNFINHSYCIKTMTVNISINTEGYKEVIYNSNNKYKINFSDSNTKCLDYYEKTSKTS
jgi:hypothetical protein